MAITRVRVALGIVLLVSCVLDAAWARPQGNEADSAAVKKVFDDFNNAFNSHDAHAVAVLFTDDADYITVGGATFKGSAAIEQHLAPLFSRAKTLHRDVTLKGVRFVRPDVALVDSEMVTTGVVGPNGTAAPDLKGFYDWVLVKQNGHWLISVWHESNLSTPFGQTVTATH